MKTLLTFLALLAPLIVNAATISSINVGASPLDGTGDSLRVGFMKVNTNFATINNAVSNLTAGVAQGTNVTTTNATRFGVFKETTDGVLQFFGLEQGTNVVLYRNGSNVVINSSASGGGGGGSGTVTHTAGALTLDLPLLGAGSDDIKSSSAANFRTVIDVPTHAELVTVSNYVNTAASNRVSVAVGTGGITIVTNASGGIVTFTISDDDAGGVSVTNINIGNTLFVDAINGVDATAARGNMARPFLTPTNAAANATPGDLIVVRPGTYNIGTNRLALENGVKWYGEPGARILMPNGSDPNGLPMFHDLDGAVTNCGVYGYFELFSTNDYGQILLLTNQGSRVHFEASIVEQWGQDAAISRKGGNLTGGIRHKGFAIYDLLLDETHGWPHTNTVNFYLGDSTSSGTMSARNSIIEVSKGFANMGDFYVRIGHATKTLGDGSIELTENCVVEGGVMILNGNSYITGGGTNATIYTNGGGSALIKNMTIVANSTNTIPPIGWISSGGIGGSKLHLQNCYIIGPTNVDPVFASAGAGSLIFEDSTIIAGHGTTNAIRSTNAQQVKVLGTLRLNKPVASNILLTNYDSTTTNYIRKLNVDALSANGNVSLLGAVNVTGLMTVSGGNVGFSGGAGITINGGGSITTDGYVSSELLIPTLATPNRPAFISSTGFITNASGTPDGTKFLRDDGVLAVPSGSGAGVTTNANQFGANTNGQLTIKSAAQLTNLVVWGGLTNNGTLLQSGVSTFNEVVNVNEDIIQTGANTAFLGAVEAKSIQATNSVTVLGQLNIDIDRLTNGQVTIPISSGNGPDYSITTSSNQAFTFSGTPAHGQRLSLTITNSGATNLIATIPSAFCVQLGSNVTSWYVLAANYARLNYLYSTNELATGGMWRIDNVSEYESAFAAAGGLVLHTNSTFSVVTVSNAVPAITNLVSLTMSNATKIPLVLGPGNTAGVTNVTGIIRGLEAGSNITLSDNGSNVVITGSAGGSGFAALELMTNGTRLGLGTNINFLNTNQEWLEVTGMVSSSTFTMRTSLTNAALTNWSKITNMSGVWGIGLLTNSGVLSVFQTNRSLGLATNGFSYIDMADTTNVQTWFYQRDGAQPTAVTNQLTNTVVGRTVSINYCTNATSYEVYLICTNTVRWNWNVTTNGASSFTKTNARSARLFLTVEDNGVVSAELGYYR